MITIPDMSDLILASTPDFGKMTWNSLVHDYQSYIALPKVFREGQVKQRGGTSIQFRMSTDDNGSFRMVSLFAKDEVQRSDQLIKGDAPWRHSTWNYSWDLREISIQAGEHEIIDIIKTVRVAAWDSAAKGLEEQLWTEITDSTDDTSIWGIPLWIQTSTSEGFNGGNPSAFSSGLAGISTTTYPRSANYTNQYTDKTRGDLIEKMKKAAYKTTFTAPVPFPERKRGDADMLGIYCTYETKAAMALTAEQQNENLGKGLGSMDGTFNGRSFTAVPFLDQSSTWSVANSDPVWMINWKYLVPYVLSGWQMTETKPAKLDGYHTVVAVHVDFTNNLICNNRRTQAVLVGPNH